jgi:hypothetical protein
MCVKEEGVADQVVYTVVVRCATQHKSQDRMMVEK